MAYVAVSGGEEAIAASLELLQNKLSSSECAVQVETILASLPELVDQVMSESSLYDPTLAALALKQGGGSVEEAVFLLRAFRSTLERPYVSRTIEPSLMRASRRISAAFKDIPGGQILGMTRDYSHRLLDFSLLGKNEPLVNEDTCCSLSSDGFQNLPKVASYLAEQSLLVQAPPDDTPPRDATMEPLSFPAPRSMRLQSLTRGMTQAVMALGYAAIRGFGPAHPTVGELRYGMLDVLIDHPFQPKREEEAYYVGCLAVTEAECLFSADDESEGHGLGFEVGYGLVYGQLESKAIAMGVLDFCLSLDDPSFPPQDEEFVLYHIDGIEATGFISHLKLPHYVTFQSKLNSARTTRSMPQETQQSTVPQEENHAAAL